jgi:hypothetical protein
MAHVFISYKRDTSSKKFVNKMTEYLNFTRSPYPWKALIARLVQIRDMG